MCAAETAELDLLVFHLICNSSLPADRPKRTLNVRQAGSVKASCHGIWDHTKPKTIKRNILLEEL